MVSRLKLAGQDEPAYGLGYLQIDEALTGGHELPAR